MNTNTLSAQDRVFLREFQAACDRFVADYCHNPDPDDPRSIFLLRTFEFDILELMGRKWEHVERGLRFSEEGYRHLWPSVLAYSKQAEQACTAHFQEVGYDYAGIEPPPALPFIPGVDWNKPIRVKFWAAENTAYNYTKRTREEWEYLETLVVGQICVTTRLWNGVRKYQFYTYQGYGLGIDIACSGGREEKAALKAQALKIARLLNLVTDWDYDVHMARPLRVKRAIGESIQKIKREVLSK